MTEPTEPTNDPANDSDKTSQKTTARDPDRIDRARMLLVAGSCVIAAAALVPQIRDAARVNNEDLVTTGWVGAVFAVCAASAAMFRARWLAGAVLVVCIVGMNYFGVTPVDFVTPPARLFEAQSIIWGVTPPLLLAVYHLARADVRPTAATLYASAAWVTGFALKFLVARNWRV